MSVTGLDAPCGVCGRPAGDHTLREWATCLEAPPTTDLPFAESPDPGGHAGTYLAEQLGLDPGVLVADGVVVHAATLEIDSGGVGVNVGALIHDFQIQVPGAPPVTQVKVVLIGPPDVMRKYGRLARDSANAAANRVDGGRR